MSFHYIFVVGSEYKGMLTAFLLNSIKKKNRKFNQCFLRARNKDGKLRDLLIIQSIYIHICIYTYIEHYRNAIFSNDVMHLFFYLIHLNNIIIRKIMLNELIIVIYLL